LRLVLSKRTDRAGVFLLLPQDGERCSFQNVVFSGYLEFLRMDKSRQSVIPKNNGLYNADGMS
jgi:hypothetical protein